MDISSNLTKVAKKSRKNKFRFFAENLKGMVKFATQVLLLAFLCTSVLLAPSYYDLLQVSRGASSKQIKSAYRKLSKIYHPDRNDSPGAREKFAEMSEGKGLQTFKDCEKLEA